MSLSLSLDLSRSLADVAAFDVTTVAAGVVVVVEVETGAAGVATEEDSVNLDRRGPFAGVELSLSLSFTELDSFVVELEDVVFELVAELTSECLDRPSRAPFSLSVTTLRILFFVTHSS